MDEWLEMAYEDRFAGPTDDELAEIENEILDEDEWINSILNDPNVYAD